jgi:hypothetical protein
MKPSGKSIADLQFRRKQSLTASAKTSEAAGQTRIPVLLIVRLLGSVTGNTDVQIDRQIAGIPSSSPTTAVWSRIQLKGNPHQKESVTSGCLREAEKMPLTSRYPQDLIAGIPMRTANSKTSRQSLRRIID